MATDKEKFKDGLVRLNTAMDKYFKIQRALETMKTSHPFSVVVENTIIDALCERDTFIKGVILSLLEELIKMKVEW